MFIDDMLVHSLTGTARRELQQPTPHELVFETDAPWEGNTCGYYTLFRDGEIFRMYYRGSHFFEDRNCHAEHEVVCHAQSEDGVRWVRSELELVPFDGQLPNNILWDGVGGHNFTPVIDQNPNCLPEGRYKALGWGRGSAERGLYAFQSPDGLHWSKMADGPVNTAGSFDSQNLAFWDPIEGCYVCYFRKFRNGIRDILVTKSDNFVDWSEAQFLQYPGAPEEQLYTNAIFRYPRAPHYFLGFPMRFYSDTQQGEPVFMSSRDGLSFSRWPEPVIPLTLSEARSGNRSNCIAWGLLQLPGLENEYSVYASEAYYRGHSTHLRRFSYRLDGFVALSAGGTGEMVSEPVTFSGNELEVNFVAASGGCIGIEMQTGAGEPLAGFAMDDCVPLDGDSVERLVQWSGGADLQQLSGQPVRLRFALRDAALYSFRFRTG